ncbi:MAG TPA: hypothetical protein VHM70_11080 [Polyangiaceae bacterium]|nr:hypothetical protein [Polyangiaceae bacterium]
MFSGLTIEGLNPRAWSKRSTARWFATLAPEVDHGLETRSTQQFDGPGTAAAASTVDADRATFRTELGEALSELVDGDVQRILQMPGREFVRSADV